MAIYTPPEVDAPRQTSPRRSGGWLRHFWQRVRLLLDGEEVEYLVLPLTIKVKRVHIYYRQMGKEIEVYDMRAA